MKTVAKFLFVAIAFSALASFSGCTKKEKTVAGAIIGAGAGAGSTRRTGRFPSGGAAAAAGWKAESFSAGRRESRSARRSGPRTGAFPGR